MAKSIKFKSSKSVPKLSTHKSRRFLNLLILVIITAGLIVSAFIALPQTERIFPEADFDLNLKENEYQGKSYTLDLLIKESDEDQEYLKVEKTKNILHKRLNKYGVEVVKIYDIEESDESEDEEESSTPKLDELEEDANIRQIRVVVETTKDMDNVDRLVNSRHYARIVIPKDDAVFDDPENPIAPYLKENYEYTQFTLHNFRSVVVKELPSSTGETAYFSIFKPSFLKSGDFNGMMDEHAGEQIGLMVDGFVQPIVVPVGFDKDTQQSGGQPPEFAPAVGTTEEEGEIADILYNSGVIPLSYTVSDQEDVAVSTAQPDYYTSIAIVISSILGIVIFIGWRNFKDKDENISFVLSVVAVYTIWITMLKLLHVPVDLDIMYFTGFLIIFLIKMFNYRKTSIYIIELTVLGILALLFVFGDGYTKIFAQQMISISLLAIIVVYLMKYYTTNMKKYVLK